jgi:hypothetical protein
MRAAEAGAFVAGMCLLALIAWALYLSADLAKRQRRMKAQAELHSRLLDKFGSAREVVEFLQTPGGAQFLDRLSEERESPSGGILRSVHRGIILLVLGVGSLGLMGAYGWRDNPLLVGGVLLVSLGTGFLISAVVSHRLARQLGLSERAGNTPA